MENYTTCEMVIKLAILNPDITFATDMWSDNVILTSANDISTLNLPEDFYLSSKYGLTNKRFHSGKSDMSYVCFELIAANET